MVAGSEEAGWEADLAAAATVDSEGAAAAEETEAAGLGVATVGAMAGEVLEAAAKEVEDSAEEGLA